MARSATTEVLRARATTHGMKYHPLYQVHQSMVLRCHSTIHPAYSYYGKRGIRVCEEWRKRENFFAWAIIGWKKGLTLDRINNDGNYEPGNCRWATVRENNRNRKWTKLTIVEAAIIKDLARYGNHSLLAALFGVCRAAVTAINCGKNWKDIPEYMAGQ